MRAVVPARVRPRGRDDRAANPGTRYESRHARLAVESAKPTTRVVRSTTEREAGKSQPRMVTDDPPGIGFPGRDGTLPAMTPIVSVPGDTLFLGEEYRCSVSGVQFPHNRAGSGITCLLTVRLI
ncbi:MAG TPA: hypothetical protein VFJ06_01495 [Halococcus sp.]|nr:hypothetical protein [Halococcus sp.]